MLRLQFKHTASIMKLVPFFVTLKNGESATIREVGPPDQHLLKIGFEHLSDRSRQFRFLGAHPKLMPSEVSQFTAENDVDHLAIGVMQTDGCDPLPLGVARYIRLCEQGKTAEFAVTIVDSHQGIGLGSFVLGVLAKHAVKNGICEFYGLVHTRNEHMLRVIDQLGGQQNELGPYEVEVTVPLRCDPAGYPQTSVGDAFRAAYDQAQIA